MARLLMPGSPWHARALWGTPNCTILQPGCVVCRKNMSGHGGTAPASRRAQPRSGRSLASPRSVKVEVASRFGVELFQPYVFKTCLKRVSDLQDSYVISNSAQSSKFLICLFILSFDNYSYVFNIGISWTSPPTDLSFFACQCISKDNAPALSCRPLLNHRLRILQLHLVETD